MLVLALGFLSFSTRTYLTALEIEVPVRDGSVRSGRRDGITFHYLVEDVKSDPE